MANLLWNCVLIVLSVLLQSCLNQTVDTAPDDLNKTSQIIWENVEDNAVNVNLNDRKFKSDNSAVANVPLRSRIASTIIRFLINAESRWYSFLSETDGYQVGLILAAGIISTFIIILISISIAIHGFGILIPFARVDISNIEMQPDDVEDQITPIIFALDEDKWISQLEQWVNVQKQKGDAPTPNRFRCCLLPEETAQYSNGSVYCYPYRKEYPHSTKCRDSSNIRDVHFNVM